MGCNCKSSCDSSGGEYMIVKAVATKFGQCHDEAPAADTENKTYDATLSDFTVPAVISSTEVTVSNGTNYVSGQWFYFPSLSLRLKVIAINGNILRLRNGCDNGEDGLNNPPVGTTVPRGAQFYVIDTPECEDQFSGQSTLDELTQGAEDVLLPLLGQSTPDEDVQPVGLVMANSAEPTFRKRLARILGVIFRKGKIFLTMLGVMPENQIASHGELYMDVSTNEVRRRRSFAELGVSPSGDFFRKIQNNQEKFVTGKLFDLLLDPIVVKETLADGETVLTPRPINFTLSAQANGTIDGNENIGNSEIDELGIIGDSYHVLIRGFFGVSRPSGTTSGILKIGDKMVSSVTQHSSVNFVVTSFSAVVKVDRASNKVEWEISEVESGTGPSPSWFYLGIYVDGVYH